MICPKCKNSNSLDAKFCFACGHSLGIMCPACRKANPPAGKFCIACGRAMEASATPQMEGPATISHLNDHPVNEKAIPLSLQSDGERKYVTILVSDLSNYTALSGHLDPEEIRELLNRIFGEISKIVAKYGGFIEKFLGDAVMALFGAIRSHEDDPIRAIRAACEIHQRVSGLTVKFEDLIGLPLSMHSGITTGLVVTGAVPFQNGSYGLSGVTPNLAVHLSEMAKPGEILVGPETHRLARRYFDFDRSNSVEVEGICKPIEVFRVSSIINRPKKIHRYHGLRAGMIGRTMELELLSEAVDKLRSKKGSVVTINGNPGTGKSRLLEGFKSTLNLEKVYWLEGQCYPYTRNITYAPLIDMLNRTFRIEDDDPPEKVREKIAAGLNILEVGEDIVPYIGSLYNLSFPELDDIRPEKWRNRLQEAVLVVLNAMACRAPTIICLEDLHWADPSSLELIRFLLSDFKYPALILCVHRPPLKLFSREQISDFGAAYMEIRLEDLSASESMRMVESLLGGRPFPFELKKFLREEAGGNPFYLEEVINSLVESQTLVDTEGRWSLNKAIERSAIPTTIHGVIASRLDRLDKEMKRLVQESAVIGRVFCYDILNRISSVRGNIWQTLSGLETLDLIKTRGFHPVVEYAFKHALTQEVVYGSLLKKERRAIHACIGNVIEQLFKDRMPEYYEVLAFHFKEARAYGNAFAYLVLSGEKILARYALEEAHAYFQDAYEMLDKLSYDPLRKTRDRIDLINKWSFVFYYRGQYKELLSILTDHEQAAETVDDETVRGMFFAWLGWALWHRERFKEAHNYLSMALAIGEEKNSSRVVGYASCWLSWVCAELGLLDDAVRFADRAVQIFKTGCPDQYIYFCAMAGRGYASWHQGDHEQTLAIGRKLLAFSEEQSDQRSRVMGFCCIGWSHMVTGNLPLALASFEKAMQVSVDPWYAVFPRLALAYGLIIEGNFRSARDHIDEILDFSNSLGAEFAGRPAQFFQAIVLIAEGESDRGLKIAEKIYRSWLQSGSVLRQSSCGSVLASVYTSLAGSIDHSGRAGITSAAAEKAHAYFQAAIQAGRKIGANGALARAYLNWGYLHQLEENADRAGQCFTAASQYFRFCSADAYLEQTRNALAMLNTKDRGQKADDSGQRKFGLRQAQASKVGITAQRA